MNDRYTRQSLGFIFVLPQCLLIVAFYLFPLLKVAVNAFFYTDPFGLYSRFAGLHNFVDVLFDPSYAKALQVTFILIVGIVLLTTCVGLCMALLLQAVTKGRMLYKLLLLWPYAVAPAIAAILWRFLLHPNMGWLNEWFHFSFNYLIHPNEAWVTLIIVSVWQQLSYNILFFFLSLEAISPSLIEAATMEGASYLQCLFHIRLPLLLPTIGFLGLMNILYAAFDTFSMIDILTQGGPGNETTTLLYKLYKDGFLGLDWSSAAAQSILLTLFVVFIGFLQQHYFQRISAGV